MVAPKLLRYFEGSNMNGYSHAYYFYNKVMTTVWHSPIENYSLTQVEYDGKEYHILKEMYEDTPTGVIFQVVNSDKEPSGTQTVKLLVVGEISDGWSAVKNNPENEEIIKILQKWWAPKEIEELKQTFPQEFPKFLLRRDLNDPVENEEMRDRIEEGNEIHESLGRVRESVDIDMCLSRCFCDLVSSSILFISKKLVDEMNRIGYEENKEVEEKQIKEDKIDVTEQQVREMDSYDAEEILEKMSSIVFYYIDKRDQLIYHLREISRLEKLKREIPKDLKRAKIEQMKKAIETVVAGDLANDVLEAGQIARQKFIEGDGSWKSTELKFRQSAVTKMLVENGIYPSSEIVIELAAVFDKISEKIIRESEQCSIWYETGIKRSLFARLAINGNKDLSETFKNLETLKIDERVAVQQNVEFKIVNSEGQEWGGIRDTRKFLI